MPFTTALRLAGISFLALGLAHILYLILAVEMGTPDPLSYWGCHFFGVAYSCIGIQFFRGKSQLLLPALIVNSIGLLAILKAHFLTPLWPADPYFLAADLVTVPALAVLWRWSKRRQQG